jgi:hypothetical protein
VGVRRAGPQQRPRRGDKTFTTPGQLQWSAFPFRRGEPFTILILHDQARQLEWVFDDARTGMPRGIPRGAMCVQRFDDSLNSAIHTTYRISLRSSSMREPRDPLLKVLTFLLTKLRLRALVYKRVSVVPLSRATPRAGKTLLPRSKWRGTRSEWGRSVQDATPYVLMILPQVHLRKPCYDFYFL